VSEGVGSEVRQVRMVLKKHGKWEADEKQLEKEFE
jgi:hypothetical protein